MWGKAGSHEIGMYGLAESMREAKVFIMVMARGGFTGQCPDNPEVLISEPNRA